MRRTLLILLAACSGHQSSTTAQVTGDTCAVHVDQTTCLTESGCQWYGLGRPCPTDGSYCQSGVCQGPNAGSGSGSASGGAACACPDGGVCFEQIGGTAQDMGGTADIQCAVPAAGSGDVCARIEGEGTCRDSETVSGLCICDNGIR